MPRWRVELNPMSIVWWLLSEWSLFQRREPFSTQGRGTRFPASILGGGSRPLPLNLHTSQPPLIKKIGKTSSPDYRCKMYQNKHTLRMRETQTLTWNWGQIRGSNNLQMTEKHSPRGHGEIYVLVGKCTCYISLTA